MRLSISAAGKLVLAPLIRGPVNIPNVGVFGEGARDSEIANLRSITRASGVVVLRDARPIPKSFGHMRRRDSVVQLQIRDRSRHAQHAMKRARR